MSNVTNLMGRILKKFTLEQLLLEIQRRGYIVTATLIK